MRVRVNGTNRDVRDGATVAELLAALGVVAKGVAVAVDGTLVARADHERTVVPDSADVEVLTAVQGG